MKRFFKIHNGSLNTEETPEEYIQNFDKYRIRHNSPFKLRAPTPPRSKESSPRPHTKTQYLRHSSLDNTDVFVLKVPFSSVNFMNQSKKVQNSHTQNPKKHQKPRKNFQKKGHRRSGSVDGFYYN